HLADLLPQNVQSRASWNPYIKLVFLFVFARISRDFNGLQFPNMRNPANLMPEKRDISKLHVLVHFIAVANTIWGVIACSVRQSPSLIIRGNHGAGMSVFAAYHIAVFSVVLDQLYFLLAFDKPPVRTHKNQCLPTLSSPLTALTEPRIRIQTMAPD